MKALDTSALLSLLVGDRAGRDLVRKIQGVEVATTEANLLELAYLAPRGPARLRAVRRAALSRLRRKLTVLPLDTKAVEEASRRLAKGETVLPALTLAMLSILETSGCEELLTTDRGIPTGKWRFKVSRIAR
jgi:predicted nucleic acid-binding protein